MGLIVNVLKNVDSYDCSNNGLSEQYSKLCVVNVSGPFEPDLNTPAVMLVKHDMQFKSVYLVPALFNGSEWIADDRGMFGGNFAYTSDSRMGATIGQLLGHEFRFWGAIKIHDRIEG